MEYKEQKFKGEWTFKPKPINQFCNVRASDYYLEIRINNTLQGERKALNSFKYIREEAVGDINITQPFNLQNNTGLIIKGQGVTNEPDLTIEDYGLGVSILFKHSGGIPASILPTNDSSVLGLFNFRGSTSSGFTNVAQAQIRINAVDNYTSNALGSEILFSTTERNHSNRVDRMKISHDGNIFIYNATLNATRLNGSLSWINLEDYPVSCNAGTYITQLGDSVTCTTADTSSTDDLNLGNFTNSSTINISMVAGKIKLDLNVSNALCIALTGSSALCDGTDATGSASGYNFAEINTTGIANISSSSTSVFNQIHNLTLNLPASGDVFVECVLPVVSSLATSGVQFEVNVTGGTDQNTRIQYYTSATAQAFCRSVASTMQCASASGAITTTDTYIQQWSRRNALGQFKIALKAEAASSTVTVEKGAWCRYTVK